MVPLGQSGEWDSGYLVTAFEAFRYGDEIRLYYTGSNFTHGHPARYEEFGVPSTGRGTKYNISIGLATWPLDRFVSADAGTDAGTLTTVPVHFTGDRLELNAAAAQPGAQITVEILDAAGRPNKAWGTSDPVIGDSLRQTVTWKGKADVGQLAGKPVSIRFTLRNAALFLFSFRTS